MMKEEEKKRRDGDAMRKRNHVIPVRLNAREVRELNEQVERSGLSRGRVYAFVDFGERRYMPNPASITPNCSEKLQAYATMPISLPMLPMLLEWQVSRAFRKCCVLPKKHGIW